MRIIIPSEMKLSLVRDFMLFIVEDDFNYKFNPEWHWDIASLKETYLNSKSLLLAAEEKGEIIATIAGRPYDRDYRKLKGKYDNNTLGVWRHYVKKELRGNGIGTKLLDEFEKQAKNKGYKKLYLHTQKTIPGSLEYWLAKGYLITNDTNDRFKTVHLEKTF